MPETTSTPTTTKTMNRRKLTAKERQVVQRGATLVHELALGIMPVSLLEAVFTLLAKSYALVPDGAESKSTTFGGFVTGDEVERISVDLSVWEVTDKA